MDAKYGAKKHVKLFGIIKIVSIFAPYFASINLDA